MVTLNFSNYDSMLSCIDTLSDYAYCNIQSYTDLSLDVVPSAKKITFDNSELENLLNNDNLTLWKLDFASAEIGTRKISSKFDLYESA